MKSGLYRVPGLAATCLAPATASWLLCPTMNEPNVYFSFGWNTMGSTVAVGLAATATATASLFVRASLCNSSLTSRPNSSESMDCSCAE